MEQNIESFDTFDENDLALVINQVARRMLILRVSKPDTLFWHNVLVRVNQWLLTDPCINALEECILLEPPFENGVRVSGRARAVIHMRRRSGARLNICQEVIDNWIKENIGTVHSTVRESWLCNEKNRKSINAAI